MTLQTHSEPGDRFQRANQAKASFGDVYNQTEPSAYYRALLPLDYRIVDEAAPMFREIITQWRSRYQQRHVKVLDVGCSYGINAAVLRYGLTFATLGHRYLETRSPSAVPADDQAFFRNRTIADDALSFVGLDTSQNAQQYARQVGLLDGAIAENLEQGNISSNGKKHLQGVDLVISTGCIGYVTERTLGTVVDSVVSSSKPPWVASFVLRMFSYDAIASRLASQGLVTRKMAGTFRQRRFHGSDERRKVLQSLERRGIDPSEHEAQDDYLHAELFLSRPADSSAG